MDNNFFSNDEMQKQAMAQQQAQMMGAVTAGERKVYVAGLVLGIAGAVIGIIIPILGLVLSIIGLTLTNKNVNMFNTKPAKIASIAGIVVSIIAWIVNMILIMPQVMDQVNAATAAQ